MHVFGLTGGIASGKSTVAAEWRRVGLAVIDADEVARDVVALRTDGLAAIVSSFGIDVLSPDGSLNRKALAAQIFVDETKRRTLNAITHPRIAARGAEIAQEYASAGHELACWEAALIVENGAAEMWRPLVVVAAPENVQIARIQTRDGISEGDARARVKAQMPLAEKVKQADYVIDTDAPIATVHARAREVLVAIARSRGVNEGRFADR